MSKLDEALARYKEVFDMQYIIEVTHDRSDDELIAEIEHCISSGEPQHFEPWDGETIY